MKFGAQVTCYRNTWDSIRKVAETLDQGDFTLGTGGGLAGIRVQFGGVAQRAHGFRGWNGLGCACPGASRRMSSWPSGPDGGG